MSVRRINVVTLEDRKLFTFPEPSAWWISREADLHWSPSGEWIAYSYPLYAPESEIYLIRPDGSETRQLTDNDIPEEFYQWTEDGQSILYWSPYHGYQKIRELILLDVESLQRWPIARFREPLESWEELMITDVHTLHQVPLDLPGKPQNVHFVHLLWTPDFRYLVVLTAEDIFEGLVNVNLYWVDIADGSAKRVDANEFLTSAWSFSPDGTVLAIAAEYFEHSAEEARTYLLDMTTGKVNLVGQELGMPTWAIEFSPDGTMLSFVNNEGRFIYHLDTGEVTRLPELFGQDWHWPLRWSPRMFYGPGSCQGSGAGE